jgi:glycosyltransferase involved in cell wall biosynthesis
MPRPPLISVLIPAYNAEGRLGQAIESALAQSWPRKEVIVVDDGSSDGTLDVAGSFSTNPGVQVISQENAGAANARNRALAAAQGDYIQWLDADDLLHPHKIRLQMESQTETLEPRILFTSAWGSFYYCVSRARYRPDGLWKTLGPIEWLLRKFSRNLWMNPACWLVSRELTEAAGLWDERLVRDNDGEYLCRLVCNASQVRFVPEARCYYRAGDLSSRVARSFAAVVHRSLPWDRGFPSNSRGRPPISQT